MKINLKIFSLLLVLLFITVGAVSAASDDNQTIQLNDNEMEDINSIDDVNDIELSISPNAKTFTDLQSIFWATKEGDTITLDSDYIYNEDFRGGRTIGIGVDRASLTVDGNGHTIDGNKKSRILFVDTNYGNLILKNINFINGYNKDGSGAILCKGSNLQIINCTFTDNNGGNMIGGAVSVFADNATITNSKFTNNIASQSGGALRLEGYNQKVIGNTFTGNVASEKLGGAISMMTHNGILSNNTFTKNVAGRDGGAFNIQGLEMESHGVKNTISNNKFYENSAIYGGAASLKSEDCIVTDNEFMDNYATELGGAMRISGALKNTGTVTNNIFTNNHADLSGGAVYIDGNGTEVTQNTFESNTAKNGAGGAFDINGHNTIVQENTITHSTAKTIGGAFYLHGNNIQVIKNEITKASSGGNGGGAYIDGASATVTNNKFTSCNSGTLGGALLIKSNNAILTYNDFIQNIAKTSGGAVYLEGASVTMKSNTFTENQAGATSVGGAVRWTGNNAKISDNTFTRNTAQIALDIYGSGTNPTISNNQYSSDEASSLRWEGSSKIKTTLTFPNKSYSVIVTPKTLTATLKDANGKALSSKEINFSLNGKTLKGNTNTYGVVSVKAILNTVKTYDITVKFTGDNTYEATSTTSKIKVIKDKVKAIAPNQSYKKSVKNKKVTFTLKTSTNKPIKGKTIKFTVNGKTYSGKTNAKGVATAILKLTKKGTFKVVGKFAGDKTYNAISKTFKVTIK